ncbi:hypothetical protein AC578_10632 [Pseudocercospora eumusae]|uniref:L-ornithine N(5)-monooxygenase [NAD(P)H] n=1 Tax=Pseudocercospora eumusae TaxID=321146 RepID=A0A139HKL2_9PEZI|nr:hypothetical protein AC578_10632 [Pseudocercospora eumusae]
MLNKPESVEGSMPPEIRARQLSGQQTPKVHLKTLEHLYKAQYSQKLMEPHSSKWRFQIRPLSEVVGASREGNAARIVTRNPRTGEIVTSATAFDVIICATGYEFATNVDLVGAVKPLLDASGLTVDREYHVNFRHDVLSRECGMWLLGSLEDVKQRGDNFSLMAERARRAAQSVSSKMKMVEKSEEEQYEEQAVL